jgi:hypothetical protein
MKSLLTLTFGVTLLSLVAATPALAEPAACLGPLVADARMPNGRNFDPPRHYDTEAHARARAISAWQARARATCGRRFGYWPLAQRKSISCEGYAGGIGCTARAVPARS